VSEAERAFAAVCNRGTENTLYPISLFVSHVESGNNRSMEDEIWRMDLSERVGNH